MSRSVLRYGALIVALSMPIAAYAATGGVTLKKITQIGRTAALVIAYSVPPKRTT